MSHTKVSLTEKIGVPEKDKFESWSRIPGYYKRDTVNTNTFKTDKQFMNDSLSTDELLLNRSIVQTMVNKNKKLVEFNSNKKVSVKTLSRSSSTESFVNYKKYFQIFQTKGTPEQFYKSFQKYLKYPNQNEFSSSGKILLSPEIETISVFDIDLVIRDCIGEDAAEFIINEFKELATSLAVHCLLKWSDFKDIIDKVYKTLHAECLVINETPALFKLMNKPRTVDPNLGALGDLSTTYRDNFNTNNDISFQDAAPTFQYNKPIEEYGESLNKAAKLLCAGTTKVTKHIPGFHGHIPTNLRNERKLNHAGGKLTHSVVNNLILTQHNMGCVLGYTGHVPTDFHGDHNERMTACDMRTTNGASFCGNRTMI